MRRRGEQGLSDRGAGRRPDRTVFKWVVVDYNETGGGVEREVRARAVWEPADREADVPSGHWTIEDLRWADTENPVNWIEVLEPRWREDLVKELAEIAEREYALEGEAALERRATESTEEREGWPSRFPL